MTMGMEMATGMAMGMAMTLNNLLIMGTRKRMK
jgi:hypothetical protein